MITVSKNLTDDDLRKIAHISAEHSDVTDPVSKARIADICVLATRLIETYDRLRAEQQGGTLIVDPFDLLADEHYQMIRSGFVMNEAFRFYILYLQSRFGEDKIDVPREEIEAASMYLLTWMTAYEEHREGQA
jgi:hypothetical protein